MNYTLKRALFLSIIFFAIDNHCSNFDPKTHAQQTLIEQGFKTAFSVAGTQLNEELTYQRTKNRALTPVEAAAELNHTKNAELADAQKTNAQESSKLTQLQIEEAQIDKLNKLLETAHKHFSLADNADNEDKHKIMSKRIEKQLDELTKDLPELTSEELEQIIPKKSDSAGLEKPQYRKSLLSQIFAPMGALIATTGKGLDFVADYSFAYITNLGCFKETYIGNNSRNINRLLVAATIIGMAYTIYNYKNGIHNDEDDDLNFDEF